MDDRPIPPAPASFNDTLVGGAVECASLAIGDDCELSGDYTVLQADVDAGQVENTATAGAAALGEEQTASVNTEVQELSLAIEPAPAFFAAVSDVITYTYRVRNSGTVTLHGTLGITDDTVVGITCSELPETGLAPAAATTCTGSYAVTQADVDAGAVHNRATATLDGLTSPAATAAVAWQAPPAGQPSLTLAPAGAAEDVGSLAFAVTLSRASAQTVTVAFASADVTAQAGVDYSEANGTLTFGPGTMAATIAVAVDDDELAETEETFELRLSAAWNATLGAGVPCVERDRDDHRRRCGAGCRERYGVRGGRGADGDSEWSVERDRRGPRHGRAELDDCRRRRRR